MERYEKIRVIGQGAFGKVFLCRGKVKKQQLIVIKQIPLDELQNIERKAARNEVEVLSILKHPNIIAYFDNFVEEKSLMIVMEYAPGGTLFEFIQDRNGVLMEEEHILQFFAQLLVAIEHIHSLNILHRDLKTQNIMLNKKRTVLKIGDFGISKVLSSKITSAQTVVGTPCYISPEICEGKPYAKKSDIWALGCILYELTTLKKAFEGPNLPALVLKIMQASVALQPLESRYSRGLKELIYSLLQRNPDDRPDVHLAMANPFVVNPLMNLCTDIGRLPCTRPYSKPEGRRSDSGVETGTESGMMGSGLRKGVRQRSFFEDEYSTATGESVGSLKFVPQTTVYMWGNGTALPLVLPSPSDSRVVGVTCGRSQKTGVTEDGKLFLWQSSLSPASAVAMTLGPHPKSPAQTPQEMMTKLITGESSAFIRKVSSGDMYYACLTDKGILMTFGSGVNGCLGYGNYDDAPEVNLYQASEPRLK
jgi:serine/threonine protein kinase